MTQISLPKCLFGSYLRSLAAIFITITTIPLMTFKDFQFYAAYQNQYNYLGIITTGIHVTCHYERAGENVLPQL